MIVIFAHARSGSNSLQEILETNKKIRILREPFNIACLQWLKSPFEFKMNVKDKESLNSYLKLVSEEYNGIKTLMDQLPFELNKDLILNPNNKIIFLTRKNLLQTVISGLISNKTKIWSADKNEIEDYKRYILEFPIGYLSPEKIKEEIKTFRESNAKYKKILEKNNIRFFNLYHEELFDNSIPEKEKLNKIKMVFEFLGYNQELNLKKIREILDPKNKKMTNKQVYMKIPNIKEIENKLGNKENGFIFNEKPSKFKILKNNFKSIFLGDF